MSVAAVPHDPGPRRSPRSLCLVPWLNSRLGSTHSICFDPVENRYIGAVGSASAAIESGSWRQCGSAGASSLQSSAAAKVPGASGLTMRMLLWACAIVPAHAAVHQSGQPAVSGRADHDGVGTDGAGVFRDQPSTPARRCRDRRRAAGPGLRPGCGGRPGGPVGSGLPCGRRPGPPLPCPRRLRSPLPERVRHGRRGRRPPPAGLRPR